jgi:hypothetical protein
MSRDCCRGAVRLQSFKLLPDFRSLCSTRDGLYIKYGVLDPARPDGMETTLCVDPTIETPRRGTYLSGTIIGIRYSFGMSDTSGGLQAKDTGYRSDTKIIFCPLRLPGSERSCQLECATGYSLRWGLRNLHPGDIPPFDPTYLEVPPCRANASAPPVAVFR